MGQRSFRQQVAMSAHHSSKLTFVPLQDPVAANPNTGKGKPAANTNTRKGAAANPSKVRFLQRVHMPELQLA